MSSRTLFAALATTLFACPLASLAQPTPPAAAPAPTLPPAAAVPASPNLVAGGDIVATLKASAHFTILSKALDATQLSATLKATPNLTLFAPTDEAFNALPAAQLAALLDVKNVQTLQKILIYHLVNLPLDSSKIKGAKGPVPSVEKSTLRLDGSGTPLKVNDADIIQADVRASNGFIQVIDKVLIPTDVTLPIAGAATAG